MPGVFQMSLDVATDFLCRRAEEGFGAYLVFGVNRSQERKTRRVSPRRWMKTTSSVSSCAE